MMTIRDKYLSDTQFHALVDTMVAYINQAEFTPTEMRQAAVLASIIYSERHVRRIYPVTREMEEALSVFTKYLESEDRP